MTEREAVKPVIKWTGGKSQLVDRISEEMPEKYNNFIDPFFGGGAVPFALANPARLIFNDANKSLVDMYLAIRDNVYGVINELKKISALYPGAEGYYRLREIYNLNIGRNRRIDAARFICLNKRCFNGLFRLNKKGAFNVPYANRELSLPSLTSELLAASRYLAEVSDSNIYSDDYKKIIDRIKPGDLVFLDPPYIEDGHSSTDQLYGGIGVKYSEFVNFVDNANDLGAFFILTNNAVDEVFNIFSRYNIKIVDDVKRAFRPNGVDRRGKEVIIKNF